MSAHKVAVAEVLDTHHEALSIGAAPVLAGEWQAAGEALVTADQLRPAFPLKDLYQDLLHIHFIVPLG